MGLTRLVKAGLSLMSRKPERAGMFIARDVVAQVIKEDADLRRDAGGARPCTDHAAAKSAASIVGKRQVFYDRKGIAVLMCRHGQARRPIFSTHSRMPPHHHPSLRPA
jgi:hypothetical protein